MDDSNSPWEEALDVDDSDLPSVLLRCKRRHDQTTVQPQPILTPSSQTLASSSQHFLSPPPPPQASFRLIPGPAGAVQAAMLRKARDTRALAPGESPVSTQEYIRKAVEDAEEDHDFKGNPWFYAINFLKTNGGLDDLIHTTPLNDVMKRLKLGKVDKVVAVIKSCTPNGLGDFLLTLKDPTATFGAIIHGKIFSESEFAKDISVGSVLIIQKVSVFSPTKSAHYLVINLRNIVKVFSKETCSQLRQNSGVCAVKYAPPGTEFGEKSMNVEKSISREPRRTEGIMNEMMRRNGNEMNPRTNNQKEMRNPTLVQLNETQLASQGTYKSPSVSNTEQTKNCAANLDEKMSGGKQGEEVEKQSQPLITKASIPEWTDDQLNELFDMDCDDDGSLF